MPNNYKNINLNKIHSKMNCRNGLIVLWCFINVCDIDSKTVAFKDENYILVLELKQKY